MIDQGLAMIGFTGLEQLREAGMRRSQRLRRKHLAKKQRARAELVLLHQHQIIHRLGLAFSPWPTLLVIGQK